MVSITSGNGRPGLEDGESSVLPICLTRQCSDDPISMRILGAFNTPKNEIILNFDDLCCFLDALVFLFHGLLCSYLSFFVPFPVA